MPTTLTRRRFLSSFSAAVAGSLAWPVADLTSAEDNEPYIKKSQPLPQPKVFLPTDLLPAPTAAKKRVAAITTTYFKYSHADDIITKFIEGYGVIGRTHLPHCDVVSMYVDQFSDNDIGQGMAARYGIPLFDNPQAALTVGGADLAVDAVLLIGEHGDYPLNQKGQKLYPRRRLFEEIVKVFRRSAKSVPVFNDKHLSYSWENAKWMVDQSRESEFPMMAGSSVPVTWRVPPLAFRQGTPVETALVAGSGGFESYGFHCLELLQMFVEHRPGGEVGVKAVQALEGEAAWKAARAKSWPAELLPAAMRPVPASLRREFDFDLLKHATVFRVEYSDGFEAAVCMNGGFVSEFCFAASVKGRSEPVATWAQLPKPQRDHFSFLCNHIEVMFRSGKPSYPVDRTLLVTGVLEALHDSRAAGGQRVETPHLRNVGYTPAKEYTVG